MGRIGTLIENKNSLLGLGMIEKKKKPEAYLISIIRNIIGQKI